MEKNDVQGDDAHKHSSDPLTDALVDSKMVKVHMVINFLYVYQLHIEWLNMFVHLGCRQANYPQWNWVEGDQQMCWPLHWRNCSADKTVDKEVCPTVYTFGWCRFPEWCSLWCGRPKGDIQGLGQG